MKNTFTLFLFLSTFSVVFSQALSQVPGVYTDAVYVSKNDRIYAVTTNTDPDNGNSVCRIDPSNGNIEACFFVGSSPSVVTATDDGDFLYIGFLGETSIKRFSLNTNEVDLSFSTGGEDDFLGPFHAEEILPLRNSNENIAVSLQNRCCSPRHEGVVIYRNGVAAANATPDHTGSNSIAYTDRDNQIIGYNNETTDFGLRRMSITNSGVTVTSTYQFFSDFSNLIEYADGRLYSTNGQFVNINNGIASSGGEFSDNSFSFRRLGVEPVPAINRVFFFGRGTSGGYQLESFNGTTLTTEDIWNFSGFQTEDILDFMRLSDDGERFAAVDANNSLLLIRVCASSLTEVPPAFEGPTSLCPDDTLTVFAPAAARDLGEILWSDGSIGDSLVVTVAGDYSYAILDATACPSPQSEEFRIFNSSSPFPPEIAAPISNVLCQNGSLSLSINFPSSSAQYIWSTGDTTNVLNVDTPGSYSVIRVNNSSGCESMPSASIEISSSDMVAPSPPALSPPLDLDTCSFNSITITPDGNAAEYLWESNISGSERNDGAFTVFRSNFGPTQVSVRAISAEGCLSDPVEGVVRFLTPPNTPFIQYNLASNTLASSYTAGRNFWYFNDVLEAITEGRFYEPLQSGFYSVRGEGEACLSEASNLVSTTVTSVRETVAASREVTLSPNPASGQVNLLFSDEFSRRIGFKPVTIEVWSVSGQRLQRMESRLSGESTSLDLSGFKAGMYMVIVRAEDNPVIRKMVAKV